MTREFRLAEARFVVWAKTWLIWSAGMKEDILLDSCWS